MVEQQPVHQPFDGAAMGETEPLDGGFGMQPLNMAPRVDSADYDELEMIAAAEETFEFETDDLAAFKK